MKRGTAGHPKMRDLARRLHAAAALGTLPFKIYHGIAVAALTGLWDFAAQYCPDGRISRYSETDLAEVCFWPCEVASGLFAAMVDSGWLDRVSDAVLIHDWPAHCEDAVHMKLARAHALFADGTIPSMKRLSKSEKRSVQAGYRRATRLAKSPMKNPCAQMRTESAQMRTASTLALAKPKPLPVVTTPPPVGGSEETKCQKSESSDTQETKGLDNAVSVEKSASATSALFAMELEAKSVPAPAGLAGRKPNARIATAKATMRPVAVITPNAWADWVDTHRLLGLRDPTPEGKNTNASASIGKAIPDSEERRRIFVAFLSDRDPFLTKQAHALFLLQGRLDSYRHERSPPPKPTMADIQQRRDSERELAMFNPEAPT